MAGSWGSALRISIFGESHGEMIGVVVDGLPPGLPVDEREIARDMARRAPGRDPTSTPRAEKDEVRIVSGVWQGKSSGAPICGLIENRNTRSQDYADMETLARPGHADYTGYIRYSGYNDPRGGGHFSGRLTAPLVFAGALARLYLRRLGVEVGGHIAAIGPVRDGAFDPVKVNEGDLSGLRAMDFPLLRPEKEAEMRRVVETARQEQDSVGGVVECAAVGAPAGWGDPFFDSLESRIAHLAYSVPAVKGLAFGSGWDMAEMRGSEANDSFYVDGDTVRSCGNHNGGINGGISNGMPIIFRAAIKPTPSIGKAQATVNYRRGEDGEIAILGRHDPCIVPRAVPVLEAALLLGLADAALTARGNRASGG